MTNFATAQSISRFINLFPMFFFGKLPQTQSKRIISFEETRKFEEKIGKKHIFLIKFSHFSPGLGSPDGNALGVDNFGSI